MNDQLFAEELKAVMEAALVPQLTAEGYPVNVAVGGTSEEGARPFLLLSGKFTPFADGYRMGDFEVAFHTNYGDDQRLPDAYKHEARFAKIHNFLLGGKNQTPVDAKAWVRYLVNCRGRVDMGDYGLGSNGCESGVDDDDLVSTLHLRCLFRHLVLTSLS
ncbi:MAG: hypothetical protein ACFUZC_16570 [Chthoniobacteraceae bacterium]